MVIRPMIRNNICLNAHPAGCARYVHDQIKYVNSKSKIAGPKKVLIIGATGGYGLASRIVAAYGCGAATLGIGFEKAPAGTRTGTPGWYTTQVFEAQAHSDGLVAETLMGDAFSNEMRSQAIEKVKSLFGTVDLVIYSVASGLRNDPVSGKSYRSVLKPIGKSYTANSCDPIKRTFSKVTVEPATEEEIEATTKVMGGEDWRLWTEALSDADCLAQGVHNIAYSYIGPTVTQPIYRDGTIGKAKEHLEKTAHLLDELLREKGGRTLISINKALVTRASAVIPVVPLYLAGLFKVMKEKGIHEGCVEQMYRLFGERLYRAGGDAEISTDSEGRIRLDDWEMRSDVQADIAAFWDRVTEQNIADITDIEGYTQDFLNIHGFGYSDIDYDKDITP